MTASTNSASDPATLLAAIIGLTSEAIVAVDRERRIRLLNPAAETMFGYKADEVEGYPVDILVPQDDAATYQGWADSAGVQIGSGPGPSTVFSATGIRRDGTRFPADASLAVLEDGGKRTWVLCLRDLAATRRTEEELARLREQAQQELLRRTRVEAELVRDSLERRKAEQALADANKELASARDRALEASRLKSEFLATMSHEIRTPMSAVIGMTEMLLESQLDDEQREFAGIIQESAQALLTIINDILDFSKIEAGKLILDQEDFEPVTVVEGAAEMLAAKAAAKGLALMTFVAPEVPRYLRGDPLRLRQVIVNLLENAIKFTESGEVTVRAGVHSVTGQHSVLEFSVVDTGAGLPYEDRDRLFEPFTQADSSPSRRYGGTGLGLSICKRLVEAMGGTIEVDSEPGAGSAFRFTVRLEAAWPPAPGAQPATPSGLSGVRALIVDDSRAHAQILQAYLEAWGMQAAIAGDAHAALAALRESVRANQPYTVVLTDLVMPGMDGFAVLRAAERERIAGQPRFLLLTAYDERGQGEQALLAGFTAYLTKPIKQAHLAAALASAIRAPEPKRSLPGARRIRGSGGGPLILLAEDSQANQRLVVIQLEDLGYRVRTANDGHELVAAYREAPDIYAAILVDIHMPELDGLGATRVIREFERETGRHSPIIALTANAMEGDRERYLAAGMDDYVSKPVSKRHLGAVLARVARRSASNQVNNYSTGVPFS